MPSDLSSYLATHYLAADSKPTSKKRKRKHDKNAGGGLLIQDDDDEGWGKSSRSKNRGGAEGDDDMTPVTVGKVKEFRKTTKANWKTLGGSSKEDKDAAAAADAILASAAAESAAARGQEDEDPTVVEEGAGGAARMADGTHAGLQSAAAVTAQIERRQKEEREQFEAERRAGLVKHGEEETHYRDATGRRVDVGMKRAEARRALQEAEEKERAKKEALKGEVQIEEARRRKELLEDAKTMKLARTADDEEMNDELKGQRRWNDPMAKFLGEEDRAGGDVSKGSSGGGKAGKKSSRRPVYKGAAPPNRYGIRPGYRWDGVDRSNGFEAERFKAINRRERNKGLEYSWQMDE
ncbi:Pre-mRNA-splicing factor CWC26 [Cytospora mali]|uniref:Pre-mRNA-splicing factor CWC26 n=1 Tax=Cytospora mali TaxID=578113 RepID=A0A194UTU7_CYTMA|nr:Pre-mRNA-splicing factor CWC26 [Valsa mali var. pyri (nom. inval.)]